jgi:hypothetical protein
VMNTDGSGVSRFTTTGAKSSAMSPDGSKVAFISLSLLRQPRRQLRDLRNESPLIVGFSPKSDVKLEYSQYRPR